MNKWAVRIFGILLLLVFLLLFANLQKQLVQLQRGRANPPATSTR